MVVLCCAVVGEESVVGVDIGDQKLVGALKERIKKRAGYGFPSDMLTLYLAKENGSDNGAWLTTRHPDYATLSRGDDGVEATYLTTGMRLDPTWALHNYFDCSTPREKVIHVLVKVPDDRSTAINGPEQPSDASFGWLFSSLRWTTSYLSQLFGEEESLDSKKNR